MSIVRQRRQYKKAFAAALATLALFILITLLLLILAGVQIGSGDSGGGSLSGQRHDGASLSRGSNGGSNGGSDGGSDGRWHPSWYGVCAALCWMTLSLVASLGGWSGIKGQPIGPFRVVGKRRQMLWVFALSLASFGAAITFFTLSGFRGTFSESTQRITLGISLLVSVPIPVALAMVMRYGTPLGPLHSIHPPGVGADRGVQGCGFASLAGLVLTFGVVCFVCFDCQQGDGAKRDEYDPSSQQRIAVVESLRPLDQASGGSAASSLPVDPIGICAAVLLAADGTALAVLAARRLQRWLRLVAIGAALAFLASSGVTVFVASEPSLTSSNWRLRVLPSWLELLLCLHAAGCAVAAGVSQQRRLLFSAALTGAILALLGPTWCPFGVSWARLDCTRPHP